LDIAKQGFSVHGIDISEKMIELCNKTFSQKSIDKSIYNFSVGNLLNINYSNNFFDAIVALGFLEYQKDERKVLEVCNRLLKPGGILICSGPIKVRIATLFNIGPFLRKAYLTVKTRKAVPVSGYDSILLNTYTLSRFKKLLKPSDFTLIDYKRHGYAGFMILPKLIGLKGEIFLHKFFTKVSNFLPIDKFANDIIVVARKA
jgi:ubiquinone/menaquinone biosynthesis C-methylase UbiE